MNIAQIEQNLHDLILDFNIPAASNYNTVEYDRAIKGYEYNSKRTFLNSCEVLIDTFRLCKKRGSLR
ncbi:hypothetical protein [Flavobacterium sp. LHD-85]|uniref:hypothetical protein n=1 Tax=Flavobacterium sp. LHD-85 TaxID=3071410 RepID=UPI0027DFD427|nr:hypothetical protein [Flavobacterium sp. LHD-85]MDQ6528924.1 hypothetical protein [Flavobacterium sp. LHD-85]